MPAKVRALVIALVLGAVASAIGVTLQLLPLNSLPIVNRISDLSIHAGLIGSAQQLGFGEPAYELQNPHLAIVTVDDATYKKMGFPFPRCYYATVLRKLKAAGAKAVAFDIDFIDPSRYGPQDDKCFADAMRQMPTVIGYAINTTTTGQIGIQFPPPLLKPAAAAIGFTSLDSPGGYLLGMPMEVDTGNTGENDNLHLFALPTAAAMTFFGHPIDASKIPTFDEGSGSRVMLLLPTKTNHHQNLATGADEFNVPPYANSLISFANVYNGDPKSMRDFANGSLVYIGATAAGLFDFSTTTRDRAPGLFINARLADQLMRNIYLRVAPIWLDVALAIVLPLLSALSFSLMRTSLAIFTSLAATIVYAYLNLELFVVHLYWLDLLHVVGAMILGTMFVAIYRVINEGSQRRMVTNLFGMHVSPAIVDDILKQDDPKGALALKGKRVKATIFYSDIRGFTSMSETMTPEEIYTQLNEYFEEMCNIIFEYGGYVDKFIGDCVMAVFSAPYQTPDDAKNAVISAVKQQERILELCEKWKAEGKKEFTVGMGINTGEVVMGNLGASSRMNYTVIGDNVNVAARLYNVAKGGEIIISESTYAECKDIVNVDAREPVAVKGKTQPISIYNVKGIRAAGAVAEPPSAPPELQPA